MHGRPHATPSQQGTTQRHAVPWLDAPQPEELRACALCSHASPCPSHTRRCTEPSVVQLHGMAPPVTTARQRHGGCGPDALRMAAPFLS